ncbi:MAG: hypothetical protein AB1564_02815 [Chloroflexota bacterium]
MKSYDFLWLSLALFPLLILSFLLPLTPHDYWWYLRLGRDVLQSGAVPTTDAYSFTHFGKVLVNESWLSGAVFWLAYSAGGLALTFALRGFVIALAYGGLWGLTRSAGAGPRLAAVLTLLAGLAGSSNWSFRPQLLVYPLFAFALWILWKWEQHPTRTLWVLPLLALLWANLHGSFPLLLIVMGAALVFGRGDRKTLALVFGLSVLAALVNPVGFDLWRSVALAFVAPNPQPGPEWLPPVNAGWQMNLFFGWVLATAPLAAFSPRKLSALSWIWFLGLTWLAFSGLRYVVWDLFLLALCSAGLLAEWSLLRIKTREETSRSSFLRGESHPATGKAKLNLLLATTLLLLPLGLLPGVRENWWSAAPAPLSDDTPVAAAEWLTQHPELPGELWSNLVFSSYLIHALPERRVAIDTRLEMLYTSEDFDRYTRIARAEADWQSLLEADNINLLMVSVQSEPALITALQTSALWCEQYRDSTAVIFSRCAP